MATLTPNGDAEVKISEQGTPKLSANTIPIDTNPSVTLTVPTGKKWILKGYDVARGTGGSFINVYIQYSAVTFSLLNSNVALANQIFNQSITLNAGDVMAVVVTGTCSSTGYFNFLYTEMDA